MGSCHQCSSGLGRHATEHAVLWWCAFKYTRRLPSSLRPKCVGNVYTGHLLLAQFRKSYTLVHSAHFSAGTAVLLEALWNGIATALWCCRRRKRGINMHPKCARLLPGYRCCSCRTGPTKFAHPRSHSNLPPPKLRHHPLTVKALPFAVTNVTRDCLNRLNFRIENRGISLDNLQIIVH